MKWVRNGFAAGSLWFWALVWSVGLALAAGASEVSAAPVVLEFWTNYVAGPAADAIEDLVDEFNRTHPDIQVLHRPVPGNIAQTYFVSLAGGVAPDVGWVGSDWFVPVYTEETIVPAEELAERAGYDAGVFWPGLWGTGVGGRQWGIPFEVGSEALVYNKGWLESAGIGEAPATWDEFLETARRLTDPNSGRYGFQPSWPGYMSIQWVWRNGGDIISADLTRASFTQPETVEAVQWLGDLEYRHGVVGGGVPEGSAAMIVVHPG